MAFETSVCFNHHVAFVENTSVVSFGSNFLDRGCDLKGILYAVNRETNLVPRIFIAIGQSESCRQNGSDAH